MKRTSFLIMTTNCSSTIRAVENAFVVVTRSSPTLYFFFQSLEGAYLEASEGAEGLLDHQVHFSVPHLETGDSITLIGKPELHELPLKTYQAQPLH
jgi:hypothetical protein